MSLKKNANANDSILIVTSLDEFKEQKLSKESLNFLELLWKRLESEGFKIRFNFYIPARNYFELICSKNDIEVKVRLDPNSFSDIHGIESRINGMVETVIKQYMDIDLLMEDIIIGRTYENCEERQN